MRPMPASCSAMSDLHQQGASMNSAERKGTPWVVHAAVMAACTLACLAWSWLAGRDLNWDQLNYHVYAAYQYVDDRLDRDFMAASVQGYLNPLAYLPFYWMIRAQWHSLLIGSALAALHSACLWLVYGISLLLIPPGARYRAALIAVGVAFAFLTPVYLIEVGTSFIDVTTAIPAIGGVWLLMLRQQRLSEAGRGTTHL